MENKIKWFYVLALVMMVIVLGAFVMNTYYGVYNNFVEVITAHGTIITNAV